MADNDKQDKENNDGTKVYTNANNPRHRPQQQKQNANQALNNNQPRPLLNQNQSGRKPQQKQQQNLNNQNSSNNKQPYRHPSQRGQPQQTNNNRSRQFFNQNDSKTPSRRSQFQGGSQQQDNNNNNVPKPYMPPRERRYQQPNTIQLINSAVPVELHSFLKQLSSSMTVEQLDRLVTNYATQWLRCWQSGNLDDTQLTGLITSFARLPFSSNVKNPPLMACCNTVKAFIRKLPNPDETAQRVETALNFVQRMLQFEWDKNVDDVREAINEIYEKAADSLDFKIAEHKKLKTKVLLASDELEKPWVIRTSNSATQDDGSDDTAKCVAESNWMHPKLGWLTDLNRFCPASLPKMCVPGKDSTGVYASVDYYYDIIQSLWTAVTFSDGSNMFNACCRWRDGDKECGHVLWPNTKSRIKCQARGCHSDASLACCNQNHPYGVCTACSVKIKNGLKGSPGQQSSTNVYDGVVSYADWEDRLLISEFESRKPPQKEIHWKTTRRLACANLVGIIKTSHKGATLTDTDTITWAEIVTYDRTQKLNNEAQMRANKKLACLLINFNNSTTMGSDYREGKIEFSPGDTIAIIDCMTFAPEHIPVLIRLEALSKLQKPFNDLRLINVGAYPNLSVTDGNAEPLPFDSDIEMVHRRDEIENRLYQLIQESKLEPIIQIRRNSDVLSRLVSDLTRLARHVRLDEGQLNSFISSLLHPVHCTQGPPGTGKSYLGVAITRALLIIRKLWIEVNPSVGSPPVLILSYKNHAIDELTVDIVNAEPRVNLIRVGKSQDDRLSSYNERCRVNDDPSVLKWLERLKNIYASRDCIQKTIESHSNLALSKLSFNDENEVDKRLYRHTEALSNAISSMETFFKKIFTQDEQMNTITDEHLATVYNYHDFTNALKNYSQSQPLKWPSISTLRNAVQDYGEFQQNKLNAKDVLLNWMKGLKPRPKCKFDSCSSVTSQRSCFCFDHTCNIQSCSQFKLDYQNYCATHKCAEENCASVSLKRPQVYCGDHVCIVCVTKNPSEVAGEAQDIWPRNTCERHQLCAIQSGCLELAIKDSMYCHSHHASTKCKAITKRGDPCKGKPLPNKSFCKNHFNKDEKAKPQDEQSQVANWSIPEFLIQNEQATAQRPASLVSGIFERPTDDDLVVQPKPGTQVKMAPTQGKQEQSSSIATEETFFDTNEDDDDGIVVVEPEEESFVPDEFQDVDNVDELEEGEQIQHMREIYTAEDEEEEEFMHQEEPKIDETGTLMTDGNIESVMVNSSNVIPPADWSWDMTFEERWRSIENFISFERALLVWLNKELLSDATKSRQEHHLAKIKANCRVYQNAELIAGTIVGCITRLEAIQATNPFAIVVEEASEVNEPLLFSCFGPSTCKLELIGDHFQLQPSMMSKFDFERINKMNMSLFERLVRAPRQFAVPFNVLSLQRRMRANISNLTREFYKEITDIIDHSDCHTKCIKGIVKTRPSAYSRSYMSSSSSASADLISKCAGLGREVPGVLPHIYFWHHSSSETASSVGLSKMNVHESDMVCDLAAYLVSCGVPKQAIAVLTPYKGQMMLLRNKLKSIGVYSWDTTDTCRLSTVDRFQGDESDVVIISMVIGSKSKTPFVKLVNRMIVLLSRARIGMYIIGNLSYFKNNSVPHWEATLAILSQPAINDTKESTETDTFAYNGTCIGEKLPICCPYHRSTSQTDVLDSRKLKLGFCKEKCSKQLPCSHNCARLCHWSDEQHTNPCREAVDSPCITHPRKLYCSDIRGSNMQHVEIALKSYKCDVPVEVTKPCQHRDTFPCHRETAIASGADKWPVCSMPAHQPYVYPNCKHLVKCTCSQYDKYVESPSVVPQCTQNVDYTPPCGHTIQTKCYVKQQIVDSKISFKCTMSVTVQLPRCSHSNQVSCHTAQDLKNWHGAVLQDPSTVVEGGDYGPKDYNCNENVEFLRRCGHKLNLKCEQAFEFAKAAPKCTVEMAIDNPECGHSCKVKCFENDVFSKIQRTQPAITEINESEPPLGLLRAGASALFNRLSSLTTSTPINLPIPAPVCHHAVLLRRKCGHEEKIKCHQIKQKYPPCCVLIPRINPQCGHVVKIECNDLDNFNNWKPWSDNFLETSWKQLKDNGILKHGLIAPKPYTDFLKSIQKCNEPITLIRQNCSHQVKMSCDEAFSIITNKTKQKPCMEQTSETLGCGHAVVHPCSVVVDLNLTKCKNSVLKNCWNFDVCGQKVDSECCKTDDVSCKTETEWKCKKGHSFVFEVCQKGTPLSCPSCIVDNCASQSQNHETVIRSIFGALDPSVFKSSENASNKIMVKLENLLSSRENWLGEIPEWKRPLFKLQTILGIIKGTKNKNKNTVLNSNAKTTPFGLGIAVQLLTNQSLKEICYDDLIGIGIGYTCQPLASPQAPKGKSLDGWIKNQKQNGFDSVSFKDSMIFWDPYCFEITHTVWVTKDAMGQLMKCVNLATGPAVTITPQPVEFIQFNKKSIQTAEVNTSIIVFPTEFNGTAVEGVGVPDTWNGKRLILNKSNPSEEKTLQSKLLFLSKGNANDSSPFNGINHLKSSNQGGDYLLFLALEFIYLEQHREFNESLDLYVEELNQQGKNAHPLLFIAFAKQCQLNGQDEKARQYLDAFAAQYRDAVPLWLSTAEQEGLFSSRSSTASNTTKDKKKVTIEEQWKTLKSTERCRSEAMEKLLKLTGLEKVKQFSISLFKTALKLKQMKNQKANSITLNFAFMGNPGTGKTTVARLFAEILRDSGMRKQNLFIETTAQEVKDNGPDKFRELVNKANEGVLFLDEAHDLDPKGDFKGKPIVAELITSAENKRDSMSFIIAGYQDDIHNKLYSYNEGLKSRFEEVLFEDFSENELKSIWNQTMGENELDKDDNAACVVARRLVKLAGRKGFGNARSVRKMYENALRTAMSRDDYNGTSLKIEDIIGVCPTEELPAVKEVLSEFDSMIGWTCIKQSARELIEQVKKSYQRELEGLPSTPFFVNRIFIGNPGTGKTTCAKLYGRLLKRLNILSNGDVVFKTASDFIGSVVGESANKTSAILAQAEGKVLVIDEAYNLNDTMYGKQALDTLVEKVQGGDDRAVLLLGYEHQLLEMLRTQNPGLARRFPQEYAFRFEDYTDRELLEIFNSTCKKQGIQLSSFKVAEKAIEVLGKQKTLPNFGNAGSVNLLIQNAVAKAANRPNGSKSGRIELMPEDIDTGVKEGGDPFSLLDSLQNVDNIKAALKQLQRSLAVAKREGTSKPDVGHFVFCGSPGTGKTTVARVMAKILHQMDCLPTDRMVETSALQLTGDYVGQTKTKTTTQMSEAKGGVLFIDEAYELGKGQYGNEAMTTLLEGMTSPEYKGLVIVIAGYSNEIDEMLDLNPGLKSRFTRYLEFKDWTPDNCVALFNTHADRDGFTVLADANERLRCGFEALQTFPGWANGRDVIKLWKDTKVIRDNRVADLVDMPDKNIILDDVQTAVNDMIKVREKAPASTTKKQNKQQLFNDLSQLQTQTQDRVQHKKRQQQTQKEETRQIEEVEAQEEEDDETEGEIVKDAQRDEGVSEADWAELEEAKKEYQEKMDRFKREKEAAIREEERKRIEALILEEQRKAEAIKKRIAQICPCPAGFSWYQVGSGWRCGGGSHFVSDAQLKAQFTVKE